MEIHVLGPGCVKCETLEKRVKEAVEELNIDCHVEKVHDIEKMLEFGVMMTPALVVDGDVVFSGVVPSTEEILESLKKKI